MLDLVNGARAASGLAPVAMEIRLAAAAADHSAWMLRTEVFSHTGAEGSSHTDRIAAAGYDRDGPWRTTENLALVTADGRPGWTDEVVQLHRNLMDSPGHRVNILDPDVTHLGVGLVTGSWTVSGRPMSAIAVTENFGATSGTAKLHDAGAGFRLVGTGGADRLAEPEPGGIYDGRGGDDRIAGGDGAILLGGGGHDNLTGGARLYGGSGHDRLAGGAGADRLGGGSGIDTFVFDTAPDGAGPDTVLDFERRQDRIEIAAELVGGAAGRIPGAMLRLGDEARDAGDRLLYDPATRTAYLDPDGAGGAAARTLAVFGPDSEIPHGSDLWLI
ncbi:hemolysin-type calcium binding protein (plasmid) [Wenxinia marina DSM 24838]|uniref:Hemolysin-type calcium binding protein n=2 Tax=Wenxinia TaxID=653686 RepID=A0A0D0PJ15_9RHOB|nr:hemolysin-type calcium binding protein [Wenxinia marina DSM 24838]